MSDDKPRPMSDAERRAALADARMEEHCALAAVARNEERSVALAPAAQSTPADRNPSANAARFIALHGNRVHYVPKWNAWLVWNEGAWRIDDQQMCAMELAKDVGRAFLYAASNAATAAERDALIAWGKTSLGAAHLRDLLTLARGLDDVAVDHEQLDANGWLLNVANGTIDLRTGDLRAADPRDLLTMQAPIAFNPAARAPRFERAMEEWFPDPAVRAYVQRLVGCALVGMQLDHIFVILFGVGRNGKGTFVRALLNVLGPYALMAHLSLIVQQKNEQHDTVKADLFRMRLAVAAETDKRVSLAEASVKNLTGGDRIRCRRLYQNSWEFSPSHSLWLQTNYLPRIVGRDRGVWSRVRVVEWVADFERSAERDLDATLASEAPGILAWAVRGCLAYRQNGLTEPEAVIRATLAYRRAEDTFARFAEDAGLDFAPRLSVPAGVLTEMLDKWAAAQGLKPSRRDFVEWLDENGATSGRTRAPDGTQVRIWTGVGIVCDSCDNSNGEFSHTRAHENSPAELSHASQRVGTPPNAGLESDVTGVASNSGTLSVTGDRGEVQEEPVTLVTKRRRHADVGVDALLDTEAES